MSVSKSNTLTPNVIALIESDLVTAYEVTVSNEGALLVGEKFQATWTPDSITEVFSSLQQTYQTDSVGILLGENLASLISFYTADVDILDEVVDSEVEELFPSSHQQLGVDYKQLDIVSDDNQALIQLFLVQKSLISLLGKSLKQAGLTIHSIESLAESLLYGADLSGTSLIIWGERYAYVSLVFESQVLHTEVISDDNIYTQISKLLKSLESRYQFSIEKIYLSSSSLDKESMTQKTKKQVEDIDVNPFVGSASKNGEFAVESIFVEEEVEDTVQNEIGDDSERDLGIIEESGVSAPKPPLKLVQQKENMESVAQPPKKSNAKLIAVMVTVIVVLVGMVVGGFLVYKNAMDQSSEPPVIVATPVPQTEVPNDSMIDEDADSSDSAQIQDPADEIVPSDYSVNVLNGSGIPGEAGKVADLLEAADFTDVDTGNADSYDFKETVVQVKDGDDALYQVVLSAIQDDYAVEKGDDLDEDSEYDVVITVGTE